MHSFIIIHMVTARHIIWNIFSLIQIFSRIACCKMHNFKSFPLIQIFFNKWIMTSYCLKIHTSHFKILSRSRTPSYVNWGKPWHSVNWNWTCSCNLIFHKNTWENLENFVSRKPSPDSELLVRNFLSSHRSKKS